MGRPSKIGPDEIKKIEILSGLGLTRPMIAAHIGISERNFDQQASEREDIKTALKQGRAFAQQAVAAALFNRAKSGDVNAIRWWEMTRAGRAEKVDNTHEVDVTVSALSYEQKLIKAKELAKKIQAIEGTDASHTGTDSED